MCSKALGFLPPPPPPHLPSPSTKTSHHNHLLPTPNANVGFLENHLSLHSNPLVPCYNAPLILPVEKFEENGDIERPSQIVSAIRYCQSRSIDFVVIANGSNCLFSDQGFDGLVILNRLNNLEVITPGIYKVGSGYPFNKLGVRCSNEGYSGLEFAGGIPGTVGGAAFMNAGADGQETANVIDRVNIMTLDGRVPELAKNHLAFGHRWSSFQEMVDLAAITIVTFKLTTTTARERQRTFLKRRSKTRPIGQRSAGSVFKNPLRFEISAAELIDLAGLKGYELGGARVSDVHANFFINYNGSTSSEMLALINFV